MYVCSVYLNVFVSEVWELRNYLLDDEDDEPREDDELAPDERPALDDGLETVREDELLTDERPEFDVLVERLDDELFTLLPDERPALDDEETDPREGWRTPDELFWDLPEVADELVELPLEEFTWLCEPVREDEDPVAEPLTVVVVPTREELEELLPREDDEALLPAGRRVPEAPLRTPEPDDTPPREGVAEPRDELEP